MTLLDFQPVLGRRNIPNSLFKEANEIKKKINLK